MHVCNATSQEGRSAVARVDLQLIPSRGKNNHLFIITISINSINISMNSINITTFITITAATSD